MGFRHVIASALVLVLFLAGAVQRFDVARNLGNAAPISFQNDIEPILMDHCYECHGDGAGKGGIEMDAFASEEEMLAALGFWEGIHHNVEAMLMPPSEREPMSDSERTILATWIESRVFKLDPENPDPGRVTIRRLNREEYRNSIRDLVGDVGFDPSADLPPDDTGYGFDNVGDVLSMSPGLFEKYAITADRVLSAAIQTHPPEPERFVATPEDHFRGVRHAPNGTGSLASVGTIGVKLNVPRDGDYELRVLVGADHAGDELPKMRVRFEGNREQDFEIKAERDQPEVKVLKVKARRGDRWLEMEFLNDHYDPQNSNPRRRDRNLHILRAELVGPVNLKPPPPGPIHQAIFASGGTGSEMDRAKRIITRFARKSWRRPVQDAEVNRLLQFVELAKSEGDNFESGVKLALQAILVSPNFLFRAESQARPDDPKQVHKIDEFALASRLSYFLWSSTPDDRLLNLAEAGQLRQNLAAELDRMLADPKTTAFVQNFGGQWLQLRNLDLAQPDPKIYQSWNASLRQAMREESERFFGAIISENRPVTDLLNANFTYLNEPLARHYGIPGVEGNQFRRVSLQGQERERRGGILSHASILTITSNPTRTSPVNRGNWVLENLLGTPPPPPPEDVPDLEEVKKHTDEKLTMRQQLEIHREDPVCASCHSRMDPIGFALENYDGIGRWRDAENGQKIDPSGELYTGERFAGASELRMILSGEKKEAFSQNLAAKMLTYALGRGIYYYDRPALNQIFQTAAKEDLRFHAFVRAIVDSVPFQYRRGES